MFITVEAETHQTKGKVQVKAKDIFEKIVISDWSRIKTGWTSNSGSKSREGNKMPHHLCSQG